MNSDSSHIFFIIVIGINLKCMVWMLAKLLDAETIVTYYPFNSKQAFQVKILIIAFISSLALAFFSSSVQNRAK